MANFRIFVEKNSSFNSEAKHLLSLIQQNLQLKLTSLRVINCYDIFNIEAKQLEQVQYIVFAEPNLDQIITHLNLTNQCYLAVEPLAGQYDQRADSAEQALKLLGVNNLDLKVTSGKLIIFDEELTTQQLDLIKQLYINPLEMSEKDLSQLIYSQPQPQLKSIPIYQQFIDYSATQLSEFHQHHRLAMSLADLECIQIYFRQEQRNPSETEIKVLDTYWSDHCRHTTFETQLIEIKFSGDNYQGLFNQVFSDYLAKRSSVHGDKLASKPITLMDLATINAKFLRQQGKLADVEISAEINACSLFVDVEIDGKNELWSLQFKNETHNHPTEIEPFGGASTCVGGAIRDPLSGRSYVYQAIRVSGAADPLEPHHETLAGKLPQRTISTKAAHGFSSYGNQIGLATGQVKEIYHQGYKAKRMEVGMVIAAAPYANIRREQPQAGDLVILLGGATGRDGCGGATGSSREHNLDSAQQCSAEVQKGNPVIERKIQRLFRNQQVTKLIKKCNDFGAGGVAVAIGELADGIKINLDAIPTKYIGLTGSELAISESQERMAVVVEAQDSQQFIQLAEQENLVAVVVAEITANRRMVMHWHGQTIVDLSRDFLDTNGARASANVEVNLPSIVKLSLRNSQNSFIENYKNLVSELNIASQQGLSDMFDATIGASTILMPYGGKYCLTPAQVAAAKLPILNGQSTAASLASFAYDPDLSTQSPFHGALYAVIESVAKLVAAGADYQKIRFSFQEYFERLGNNPSKWGKPLAALLGAYWAQHNLELAAIGGKDSMSGTFNELNVPPTLISFALAPTDARQIIAPEFKQANHYVYAYLPKYDDDLIPDFTNLTDHYQQLQQLIKIGRINAAYAIGYGGIAEAIFLATIGNKLGFAYNNDLTIDLFSAYYGGIIFATDTPLTNQEYHYLGQTNDSNQISYQQDQIGLDALIKLWQTKFSSIFALTQEVDSSVKQDLLTVNCPQSINKKAKVSNAKPRVIIPVFPGTNCEYDSIKAFNQAGGVVESMVFNNLSAQHIQQSIDYLAKQINEAQILMLPGGFSAGDEPDGSAKFIVAILRNQQISDAVHDLLARDGLIIGICNGFQALIKSGLLPFGKIGNVNASSPTLTHNLIGRHISRIVTTKVVANHSPWLSSFSLGSQQQVAMSHGEGRLLISHQLAQELAANGQIACQYVNSNGEVTFDAYANPNGSDFAIEAITSLDGRILGKMGHSERTGEYLYKNIPNFTNQDIFSNGINYYL